MIPFRQNSRKCKLIYSAGKQISSCLEGVRGLQRDPRKLWGVMNTVMYMCVTSDKTHPMLHFKYVQLFVCQLHLNKAAKIQIKF